MAEIILTKLAVRDLNSIYDYIAQDSAYYARILIERIFRRIKILSDFPKSGRIIPEFEDDLFRELI